jgi:hypothetical protein
MFPSGAFAKLRRSVNDLNLISLHAFLALHGYESDLLAFFQATEAGAFDSAEVNEQIRAAFRGDETKTFLVVEPFDGAGLTIRHIFFLETEVDDSLLFTHEPEGLELVAKR